MAIRQVTGFEPRLLVFTYEIRSVRTQFIGDSQNNRFQNGLSRAGNRPKSAFDPLERVEKQRLRGSERFSGLLRDNLFTEPLLPRSEVCSRRA
jgi:hypothetical protein